MNLSNNNNDRHGEGFEESLFVSRPAEYLRCGICALVINNPIQIVDCGHKFCHLCFERLKSSTEQTKQPLQCPIDRMAVDLSRVFEDIGLKRSVGNLEVRCHQVEKGCDWIGELSELNNHIGKCKYQCVCKQKQVPSLHDNDDVVKMVQKMSDRVDKCEDLIEEKEKDISHLKFTVTELKAKYDQKVEEIKQLRNEITMNQHIHEQHYKKLETKLSHALEKIDMLDKKVLEIQTENNNLKHQVREGEILRNKMAEKAKQMEVKVENVEPVLLMVPRNEKDRQNMVISKDNHIQFKKNRDWSTACLPNGVVGGGLKAFYEVVVLKGNDEYYLNVGWATKKFLTSDHRKHCYAYQVSYSYSYKYDGKNNQDYGKWLVKGNNDVIGVALDMVNGQISFGFNGEWTHPMGVAFREVDTKKNFFPFVRYCGAEVQVNFNEGSFVYGPPDDSYVSVNAHLIG